MEICREAILDVPPVPSYPVISKTLKKNQPPVCDTFGPFPDETLLSSIDRVFFFLGARRVQQFFDLPRPLTDVCSANSDCSINISHVPCGDEHASCRSCSTIVTDAKCTTSPSRTISITKRCCCPKCRCCASRTTVYTKQPMRNCIPQSSKHSGVSRVQICDTCCGDGAKSKPLSAMKRSFSLCSLVSRKLRQKLSFQTAADVSTPLWLWTRMQSHADGSQIYEVFRDSASQVQPCHMNDDARPQIIFVVLPNGIIMPFEPLTCP